MEEQLAQMRLALALKVAAMEGDTVMAKEDKAAVEVDKAAVEVDKAATKEDGGVADEVRTNGGP